MGEEPENGEGRKGRTQSRLGEAGDLGARGVGRRLVAGKSGAGPSAVRKPRPGRSPGARFPFVSRPGRFRPRFADGKFMRTDCAGDGRGVSGEAGAPGRLGLCWSRTRAQRWGTAWGQRPALPPPLRPPRAVRAAPVPGPWAPGPVPSLPCAVVRGPRAA